MYKKVWGYKRKLYVSLDAGAWADEDVETLHKSLRGLGTDGSLVTVGVMLGHLNRKSLGGLVVDRRADECGEQRMRPGGPALEFGVRLSAHQERVDFGGVLDELNKVAVR